MSTSQMLQDKFGEGLAYGAYVATGKPEQRDKWGSAAAAVSLTEGQKALIGGFTRRVKVLVLSGIWCGDCAAQCPMLAAVEAANPKVVAVRFLDREAHLDIAERFRICGGLRVPTAIYMNEEFDFVSVMGDKVLSRLRAVAARKLGPACPLPGAPVPTEEIAATVQDWVNEFERVHLLLRLSTKLRKKYGD